MSATTISVPASTGQSWAHGLRLALFALAVAVLLTVSFAIGRATVGTSPKTTTIAPAAAVHTTVPNCRFGQPC
jgi:hypothetical protein